MRFTVLCLVGGLVAIAVSDCAKGATYTQWTSQYDQRINATGFPAATKSWLDSLIVGPNDGAVAPGVPFPDPGSVATPTPTPIPQGTNPPSMPVAPPTYVTNCPTLAFEDTFNEGRSEEHTSELQSLV